MHVLVIPRGLYDVARVPNLGVFESHQVSVLRSAGLQVGVLSGGVITTRHLGQSFPYPRVEVRDGVPILRSYRRAYLPARWENPINAADRTYRKLRPLLKEYLTKYGRPDIIHAHNLASGGLIARRISSDIGIPYVVTEHTGAYIARHGAVQRDAVALSMAASDAQTVVAVGSGLASSLQTTLAARVHLHLEVVPNVVDPQFLTRPLRNRHDVFTVSGLGYLTPEKNYALLIEAFARADLPAQSQLVIGGDGPQVRRLGHLARSLGVNDRVRFSGHLSRERVYELLRSADLFAHPSDSESFGVVLIEAMAVGVPLLATASSGPLDIVTPDVGWLTPVGDVGAFTEGLSAMYRRRSEFDPEGVREACRLRFGPEIFATRMIEIYTEATA